MDIPFRSSSSGCVDTRSSGFAKYHTLPADSIHLTGGGFWADRQALNRKVSLRHVYRMCEITGRIKNFKIAAGWEAGEHEGLLFNDSDIYKWLEGMAWELARKSDPDLQRMVEEAISAIQAAQMPDGYLNTFIQLKEPLKRWANITDWHELYCAGHLFQAAVAFSRALGDGRLLEVACRFADCIDSAFGPGKIELACGHPEVEMALVELYRETRETRYLSLAKFFIDIRGYKKLKQGWAASDYYQDHLPVREAPEAVGHAVRQLYLATGAADVFLETGDPLLFAAMERLWQDVTRTKMFITGGVGSRHQGEAFGDPYELPSDQCYCETCATIASLMFNWRMLLATGESRFADEIERALYNGILSGYALDGRHFLYVNQLMIREARFARFSTEVDGRGMTGRPEWYLCACCPPNVTRLLASINHYFATVDPAGIQIHLYGGAEISSDLGKMKMSTRYPWDGAVKVEIVESGSLEWTLAFRKPGWAQNGNIQVNGHAEEAKLSPAGYWELRRQWKVGDVVILQLPVEPFLVTANGRVDAVRGSVAIQRGPVMYCLEAHDQPAGTNLLDVAIDPNAALESEWRSDILSGAVFVKASGVLMDGEQPLYQRLDQNRPDGRPVSLTAVPYYAWGNRGLEAFRVWVPLKG